MMRTSATASLTGTGTSTACVVTQQLAALQSSVDSLALSISAVPLPSLARSKAPHQAGASEAGRSVKKVEAAKRRVIVDRLIQRRKERLFVFNCYVGRYNNVLKAIDEGVDTNCYVVFDEYDDLTEEDWLEVNVDDEYEGPPFGPFSPLSAAAEKGHLSIVKLLVKRGALLFGEGGTGEGYADRFPLMLAASEEHVNVVRFLIAIGVDVNAGDCNDSSALLLSVGRGRLKSTKILLKAGANIDAGDMHGFTSLMQAAKNRHASLVSILLTASANVHAVSGTGDTALICASGDRGSGNWWVVPADMRTPPSECILLLLRAGSNVNAANAESMTALHKSAMYSDMDSCKVLLRSGANLLAKDKNGQTPLDLVGRFQFSLRPGVDPPLPPLSEEEKIVCRATMRASRREYLSAPLLLALCSGRIIENPNQKSSAKSKARTQTQSRVDLGTENYCNHQQQELMLEEELERTEKVKQLKKQVAIQLNSALGRALGCEDLLNLVLNYL